MADSLLTRFCSFYRRKVFKSDRLLGTRTARIRIPQYRNVPHLFALEPASATFVLSAHGIFCVFSGCPSVSTPCVAVHRSRDFTYRIILFFEPLTGYGKTWESQQDISIKLNYLYRIASTI